METKKEWLAPEIISESIKGTENGTDATATDGMVWTTPVS